MPQPARRFRFGLPSLLILPLWISPLFLSTVFVREQFEQNKPSAALFFNMLACTAAYAAFFTARSRRHVYERGQAGRGHVLPAAWRGALFGLLFMAQIVVPLGVASEVATAQRNEIPLVDFLRIDLWGVLELAGMMLSVSVPLGLFLGAFGGSLVGLVFDWRFGRARATKMTVSPTQ
jgi:hypothetical protein